MPSAATMDFFQNQDVARRKTSILVAYYVLAVIFIMLAVYTAFAAAFIGVKAKTGATTEFAVQQLWDPQLFMYVMLGTAGIVLAGTLFKVAQLAGGGEKVATMLGGRPVNRNTTDPGERKILNVVEEMAIAAGIPVPPVFVLDGEEGINAFAAGFSPNDAVIGVTKGTLAMLTRDELQGVIAHEFSHILNGDMRLNIRLIGVLNGILIIGLLGYWVFRSSLFSSGRVRRSKDNKGSNLPIILLGVALMAIGYIGVFFGKLIKSAVSRQREYLADASAVQFTRNPLGIAGALKKIGGFVSGSKLQNQHAEEASHFFFSNGLTSSFLSLMATHPPLDERIRRLDPSFGGDFEAAKRAAPDASVPHAVAAGAAAGVSGFAVSPQSVVSQVGAPRSEHLSYAKKLMARLPEDAKAAVREAFGARAVVYGLLLNKASSPRERQLQRLAQYADPAVYSETLRLMGGIQSLDPDARLPLLDLAVSSLKAMSPNQYVAFRENVDHLMRADEEIDLFEFTLQRMLVRHLAPTFEKIKRMRPEFFALDPLLLPCTHLLSCLAYWGTDDLADAQAAFAKGGALLCSTPPLKMLPVLECGIETLGAALDQTVRAAPAVKKQILEACVACIGADGRVSIEEAELLRAVGDSLDCPIPPFLPGQTV